MPPGGVHRRQQDWPAVGQGQSLLCGGLRLPLAHKPPLTEPILVLDGEKAGAVTNLAVDSNVASSCAPGGSSLIQATVVGNPKMTDLDLEAN